MALIIAVSGLVFLGLALVLNVWSDRLSQPRQTPTDVKPTLDQRNQLAADATRREQLVQFAHKSNKEWLEEAGFRHDPEKFADREMARIRKARENQSTYSYHSPVVLVPASRKSTNIEVDGTSWFGGLPSLGDRMWPRSRDGSLMHHAAQIDLVGLMGTQTPKGLPKSGSLAFFVDLVQWPYKGAVVYVTDPNGRPTQPVQSLPRLFGQGDGGGYTVEGYTDDNAPRQFPRWPITFVPLDVIEDPSDYETDPVHDALMRELPQADPDYSVSAYTYKDTLPELAVPTVWDTAQRFANMLTNSRSGILEKIKYSRDTVDRRPKDLAQFAEEAKKLAMLTPESGMGPDEFAAHKTRQLEALAAKEAQHSDIFEKYLAELAFMAANIDTFVALETDVVRWAYEHDKWDRMYSNDAAQLEEYMSRVKSTLGDETPGLHLFMYGGVYLGHLVNQTLQAMIHAPDPVYKQLPQVVRDDLDRKGRVARQGYRHQMFGLARTPQGYENHPEDYLLLKLGRDIAMNWNWGEEDAYFWISPNDLENHRWGNVSVIIGHQ